MVDFALIDDRQFIKDTRIIKPKFVIKMSLKDLMTQGGELYAVWDQDENRWVTGNDAFDFVVRILDNAMDEKANEYRAQGGVVAVNYMWDSDSKSMDRFLKYVKKQMPSNNFHPLDDKLVFEDQVTTREDYSSKCLPYALKEGDFSSYDELISTLYDPDNRRKLEWAIGAVISGDSKRIQKFIVLYGEAGSGKSTILNIIQMLFEGYWKTFDSKALGQSNAEFALESFKTNPLVAIQHDGDLSKIEDNTRLNSLVSHEPMEINAKFEKKYSMVFHSFMFIGTNSPVKITNAKSGLIRRLIDVHPTGNKIPKKRYNHLMNQIKFELGAIASHCLSVYEELGENYYDDYTPIEMMAATNDFYDFIEHNYDHYKEADIVTLTEAWKSYGDYCEFANAYKLTYRIFRTELRNYFTDFKESATIDGKRVRNVYSGFRTERFESKKKGENDGGGGNGTGNITDSSLGSDNNPVNNWLIFSEQESLFDNRAAAWPSQYEKDYGKGGQPEKAWKDVKTTLSEIVTSETHYVNPPVDIPIVMIDFDKKNKDGKKDLDLNIKAASKFKPTYAELSKSGGGIHLYYFWEGCPLDDLSSMYETDVEVKIFNKEGSAIRRKLTMCNNLDISTLSSGLPKKGAKKRMVDWRGIENEKMLISMIEKNLRKEYHEDTSSSINYINALLDEAYESDMAYNIPPEMRHRILDFAMKSTNQADRCCAVVANMKFQSKDEPERRHIEVKHKDPDDPRMLVIDIEIYKPDPETNNPGLFLICWKILGTPMTPDNVVAMENPKPHEIQQLLDEFELMGFNILEYDCQMIWAASRGDNNDQLYNLSYSMINLNRNDVKNRKAKEMVGVDVYEYTKAAGEGMGLKKWEIKLSALSQHTDAELKKMGYSDDQIKAIGVFRQFATHKEMDIPWDQPAPLDKWDEIKQYCKNDVLSTEAVYWFTQNYFKARLFQVDLVKAIHGSKIQAFPRDTANTLSKRTIFGLEKNPQKEFNYRNLAEPVGSDRYEEYLEKFGKDYQFRVWNEKGLPEFRDYVPGEVLPSGWSILPFFPGYTFDRFAPKGKKSFFMDDYGGEGGRTYSKPGIYLNVYDGDIASQYPHSIMAEVLFGPRYTKIFSDIVKARIAVKHKDFEKAGKYLNGALKPYLNDESAPGLAQALKIIINSIYGLTSASFTNEFKDDRNIDNIVAKRGNLFMRVLQDQIEKMGYEVCHIKTDSIKVANADQKVKDFIIKFGREYGYEFETEAEFSKFALLNDAAYVGKINGGKWVFKADEFKQPVVRKSLFTHEPIVFEDYCMTFSTKDALYLDLNEGLPNIDAEYEASVKKNERLRKKVRKLLIENVNEGISDNWIFSFQEGDERAQKYLKDNPDTDKKLVDTLCELWDENRNLLNLDNRKGLGHRYKFVGKIGQFTPVKDGTGGGYLYRIGASGKPCAVGGTNGYRWLESSEIKRSQIEERVDLDYFRKLVDQAKDDICNLPGNVDFEWFSSNDDSFGFINIPEGIDTEVPFDETE